MKFLFEDRVSACAGCRNRFTTGDVAIAFQANAAVSAISYLCADCTMRALESGATPTHALVFLAAKYKGKDVEDLPEETRARVVEGFGIVQRLALQLGASQEVPS